jgi:hypothetical protein
MHTQKRFLLAVALALLPVDRCSAQFFTPVSTMINAETGFTDSGTFGQGPEDDEDFGNQTGTLPVSAEFDYTGLTSAASGTVTIDPAGGVIGINLSATGVGGSTPNGPLAATAYADATIIFDVPPDSGIYVSLNVTGFGGYDNSSSSLTGPDGFSTGASGENFPSVPPGQYTLEAFADTQEITGFLRDGNNSSSIRIFPEPEESALSLGIMGLLPLRRRRG